MVHQKDTRHESLYDTLLELTAIDLDTPNGEEVLQVLASVWMAIPDDCRPEVLRGTLTRLGLYENPYCGCRSADSCDHDNRVGG